MSDEEITEFLSEPNHLTACTVNHDGTIHAVAMFYGFLGADLAFQTKAKSQKIQNLRRDPRLTCLIEGGTVYSELRGVELVGKGELIEEEAQLKDLITTVRGRYIGPPSDDEDLDAIVERSARNRVVVKLHVDRVVSWDHRKLDNN
jgi:PPOX class probable F420-dependent enzyme